MRAGWAELLACRLHLVADELLACSYSRLLRRRNAPSHLPAAFPRALSNKRSAEAGQLGGALAQLEVAEAALRDSQGTASRLLQVGPVRALVGNSQLLALFACVAQERLLASSAQTSLHCTCLPQDCTNLQRENRQLTEQQYALQGQLQGALCVCVADVPRN